MGSLPNHHNVPYDPSAPIAIVGMGFRGPGDAGNLEGFFKLLSEARETRTEGQNGRWNHEAFYHPDSDRKGASNVKAGHYFRDDLSLFDAPFFRMTESEAATLDPQQRLLLETCYEALESAGTSMARIAGSRTSVFVATFASDYTDLLQRDPDSMPYYQATGSGYSRAIISNRLSHFFDLRGPSVTVDTACSGGLAALHLACQSIRSGETAQAVVGGSSVILHPHQFDSLSAMRFLSPDGRSYSFDGRAEGYARGEGVGCLFLKRLDLAVAEGDPDGGTPGISFPSRAAQVSLIKEAYARAGLDPRDTSYVEAHGTGTGAGDPIETSAIAEAMTESRGPGDEPLWIGSVKANIGHLEAASGIASVVKCVLMMENKVIFPNRNLVKVNPKIDLEGWRLKIPDSFRPWETKTGTRRLSVNSFGFGGTNVHAILESTEVFLTGRHGAVTRGTSLSTLTPFSDPNVSNSGSSSDSRYRVFVLSALDEPSLKATARNMAFYLKRQSSEVPTSFLDDLAYTLGFRRSLFPYRSAVSANSVEGLIKAIDNPSRLPLAKINGGKPQPTIGFVFTGQGAQWAGMGKELMDIYPVYAATMRRCRDCLWAIGATWDLIEEIERDAKTSSIARGKFSQPLCSALQISLSELLASWGIRPAAVTGHSSGEIASAYAAGIISLEDAMTSAYHRGVCSDKVAAMAGNGTGKKGSMIATSLSLSQAEDMISRLESGYATVACHNSPSNVTIAGDADAIVELKEILDREAVFARVLIVEAAYHSRHMEAVRDDYLGSLRGLQTKEGSSNISFYSSVTGKIAEIAQLGPQYWVDNMMGRVEFASSLETLALGSKVDILLEVGPHAALAGPVRQILQANEKLKAAGIAYASVLKIKESAAKSIAAMAAALTTRGVPVDLHAVHGTTAGAVLTNLPTYPWNRSRSYWAESRLSREFRNCPHPRQDLLGRPEPSFNPLDARWRTFVRTSENPWLRDHRIESRIVYPAAGYIAMAIEAVKQLATRAPSAYRLREVVFGQAMIVPEDDGDDEIEVFTSLRARSDGTRKLPTAQSTKTEWRDFAIYSVSGDNRWNEHCRGQITAENDKDKTKKMHQFPFGMQGIEDSEVTPVNVGQLYETLRRVGLDYGPTFANIAGARIGTMPSIARGREEEVDVCLAEVSIPDTASTMPAGFEYPHVLHPAALDAIFHTAFPPFYATEQDRHPVSREPAVPTFIESLVVFDRGVGSGGGGEQRDRLDVFTSASRRDGRQTRADMAVFSRGGASDAGAVVELRGMTLTKLSQDIGYGSAETAAGQDKVFNVNWVLDVSSLDRRALVAELGTIGEPEAQDLVSQRRIANLGLGILRRAADAQTLCSRQAIPPYTKSFHEYAENVLRSMDSCPVENATETDQASPEEAMLGFIEARLPEIMADTQTWRSVMDGEEAGVLLQAFYESSPELILGYERIGHCLSLMGAQNPGLRILEVGAGAGLLTPRILQRIGGVDGSFPRTFDNYRIVPGRGSEDRLRGLLEPWLGDAVSLETGLVLDGRDQQPNMPSHELDVVVCCHLSTSVASMTVATSTLHRLLKPGGIIILLEPRQESPAALALYGTCPSWWSNRNADGGSKEDMRLQSWRVCLGESGFTDIVDVPYVIDADIANSAVNSLLIARSPQQISPEKPRIPIMVICGDDTRRTQTSFSLDSLIDILRSSGHQVSTCTLDDADPTGKFCVVAWESLPATILTSPTENEFRAMQDIFLKSRGVLSIIRGARSHSPILNMVVGMTRTVRSEIGESSLLVLDIEDEKDSMAPDSDVFKAVGTLLDRELLASISPSATGASDTEFSLQRGRLMVPRLIPDKAASRAVASSAPGHDNEVPAPQEEVWTQPGRLLRAEIGTPGILDTIHFVEDNNKDDKDAKSAELGLDEVDIEVKAAGLNSRDVMIVMGQDELEALGAEASGIVTRVGGRASERFAVGDRIACLHPGGTIRSAAQVDSRFVQKLPHDMSFETGAALPVAYCAALYITRHVANVQRNESVLIHAAAGGLGQALIQFCQQVGAEVFTTVGSPAKRSVLANRYALPESHILDSRDPVGLAERIRAATGGRGVDVVVNSLSTSEGLRASLDSLAVFGRLVEVVTQNTARNSELEMTSLPSNAVFASFNLWELIKARPAIVAGIWAECMARFRDGGLVAPSSVSTFSFSDFVKAMRTMSGGDHTGKIVLIRNPREVVKVMPALERGLLFKPDASYVVAGGLGGIGRAVGRWMVNNGARCLVFCGRSGASSPEAKKTVETLREKGARVCSYACDIAEESQVRQMVSQMRNDKVPPVKGIIQAAMVLRDALFQNATASDYEAVVRPKVQGTMNLHSLVPGAAGPELDFFVMLSSVSGVVGNAAQAAYAAANTFLDAFAEHRVGLGLHAAALDLGAVEGVGYLSDNPELLEAMRRQGFHTTTEEEVLALLRWAVSRPGRSGVGGGYTSHFVTGLGTWKPGSSLGNLSAPLFAHFRRLTEAGDGGSDDAAKGDGLRDRLRQAASPEEAVGMICSAIVAKVAGVGMVSEDAIDPTRPLREYGVDSLNAVEVRNWVFRRMDCTVSVLELMANQGIDKLAARIAQGSSLVKANAGSVPVSGHK
ncbi:hypothetical protein LX32DRAFT_729361 [Colletotrichum zoysiae]|uniref:Beta-ketoacyl synthase domain-containing protein n=1 Tax=Colletotrichum zoysiae TaxID=1216348 RepID=A0AAD9M3L4_9PEZI|nr:hypothetical protein LX32DRAFT_729361 [Colletotrichum zoysiae]